MDGDEDAAIAFVRHAAVRDEKIVHKQQIPALPAKSDGCIVDGPVNAVELRNGDWAAVSEGGMKRTYERNRERNLIEKPAQETCRAW